MAVIPVVAGKTDCHVGFASSQSPCMSYITINERIDFLHRMKKGGSQDAVPELRDPVSLRGALLSCFRTRK